MISIYSNFSYFQDYFFIESNHTYFYKGEAVSKSVTQFVDGFITPFEREVWLEKKSSQLGVSVEELDKQWKTKADNSSQVGTQFHAFMEHYVSGKSYTPQFQGEQRDLLLERYNRLLSLGKKFVDDTRSILVPVKQEFIVGKDTTIAGQIDAIFYNKVSDKLELYDYKTNKQISMFNAWKKKMLIPFVKFDECEYNTYSLQLSIYKYLLNLQNIDVDTINIVWFDDASNKYTIIRCADFSSMLSTLI